MMPFTITLNQSQGAAIVNALNRVKQEADEIIKMVDSAFCEVNQLIQKETTVEPVKEEEKTNG